MAELTRLQTAQGGGTERGTEAAPLSDHELADLLEREGPRLIRLLIEKLRTEDLPISYVSTPREGVKAEPRADIAALGSPLSGAQSHSGDGPERATARHEWTRLPSQIVGYEHRWPEVHEHYGPITVYECLERDGICRIGIGVPRERMEVYGKERGWLSVWSVINGSPRDLLASFTEADDFETTGERVAIIRGRGGAPKAGFAPNERDMLPSLYPDERVAIHRDRCNGPQAKNRLAVVATSQDVELMLEHGLRQWRLRAR